MGAWGYRNFENDTALDFAFDISQSKGKKKIIGAIDYINSTTEYLDATECCEGLAAAEVICLVSEGELSELPKTIQEWYEKGAGMFKRRVTFDSNEILNSVRAIEKIIYESELQELWAETNEFEDWRNYCKSLATRLSDLSESR